MLKLKKLTFSNIGRFTDEQNVDFTKLGSLVQVDAQNNNTGGSSGSGKSTIFNGLDWLLGLSDISTSTLQSRLTKSHISVSGEFDWDGKSVTITRNRKLSIVIDGNETTGSSKISEEKLDEILGMPRNLFRPLLHKRQGETGFFLGLTPAKMNDFLVDTLGLSQIRSKVDVIDGKTKELGLAKIGAQTGLAVAQASLEANKRALEAVGDEPVTSVHQDLVEGWKLRCVAANTDLMTAKDRQAIEKSQLETKKPKLVINPFSAAALEANQMREKELNRLINESLYQERDRQTLVNKEISKLKLDLSTQVATINARTSKEVAILNAKLSETAMAIRLGAMSKEEAIKIASKIKTVRAGTCYTCNQVWVSASEEERLLASLGEHKAKIISAKDAENNAIELRTAIAYIQDSSSKDIEGLNKDYSLNIQGLTEQAKPRIPAEIPGLRADLANIIDLIQKEKVKEAAHNEEQNKTNNQTMSAFFADQKVLAARHQEELQVVNKELEEARSQCERLSSELRNHETNLAKHKQVLKSLTDAQNEQTSKVEQMTLKVGQVEEKLVMAEEVKRCLKSYLSCSFDDALDSISDSATAILRAVPTMANATIRLEGTKETGAGAIKDQINACIDNDGEIGIPIKSLSGGERSAVDLAIDLAVGNLIQEKANKGIDVMILDEPFNGFDSIGIEHSLEMIRTFAVDKKILIVEHDGVAKEFIQDRITVVRDGEISSVK